MRSGAGLAGQSQELRDHSLAHAGRREVLLEHVPLQPDYPQVGDPVERLAFHDPLALQDRLLDDHAADWRTQGDRARDEAALLDPANLLLRNLPPTQALSGRRDEAPRAGLCIGRSTGHIALEPPGKQEFLRGGHHHRRVDTEQRFPGADLLAGEVHVEPVDPALHAGCHRRKPGLVIGDLRHDADAALQHAACHRRKGDTDATLVPGIEMHRARALPDWCGAMLVSGRRRRCWCRLASEEPGRTQRRQDQGPTGYSCNHRAPPEVSAVDRGSTSSVAVSISSSASALPSSAVKRKSSCSPRMTAIRLSSSVMKSAPPL